MSGELDRSIWQLQKGNPQQRRRAVRAIARTRNDHGIAALRRALSDPDAGVRAEAVKAMVSFTDPVAADALIDATSDGSGAVRSAAVEALARSARPDVKPLILNALDDGDWRVRSSAIRSLTGLTDAPVLDRLVGCLDDSDAGVRNCAARALARLGAAGGGILPELKSRLREESDVSVKETLRDAVRYIQRSLDDAPAELEAASRPAGTGTELIAPAQPGVRRHDPHS